MMREDAGNKLLTLYMDVLDVLKLGDKPAIDKLLLGKDQKINPLYEHVMKGGQDMLKQVKVNQSKAKATTRFIQLPGVSDQDI